jgi:cobalamin-dependent methionine synthase I
VVVCFAGTIGAEVDEEIDRLTSKNKYSDAFVVDATGSAGAEQLVEAFHQGMEKFLRTQGKGVTVRFSPGYCDWTVEEQAKLFKLLETDLIGVELSDSFLMTPRKSVSGIFGLTSTPSSKSTRYNPCAHCGKKDCMARRSL